MHHFLSNDWAGLAMAAAVAALAFGLHLWLRKWWISAPLGLLALAMTAGSVIYLLEVADMEKRYPAPGRFVEIDGQQIHVLAEGPKNARPTIVLFGGGHAPGTSMMFLHDALKEDFRTVLIDRPGMGWSGPANFPVSTAEEAREMWQVLDALGEKGPFMVGGHSFGGLLAANMARLRPQAIHSLVLMDPTPPEVITFGPRLEELAALSEEPWWNGFFRLFALDYQRLKGTPPLPPAIIALQNKISKTLGDADAVQKAYSNRARANMSTHSIFQELTPQGMASVGYETGFFTGELGQVPLYLFAPKNSVGITDVKAFDNAEQREAMRMQQLYASVRERFLDYSNNSHRIVAPEGTSHNFIYEKPDYTIGILRAIASGKYDASLTRPGDKQSAPGQGEPAKGGERAS